MALFRHLSVIGSFRVLLDGKSPDKEYPVNAGVAQGSILGPTIFYYTLKLHQDGLYLGVNIRCNRKTCYH